MKWPTAFVWGMGMLCGTVLSIMRPEIFSGFTHAIPLIVFLGFMFLLMLFA